MLSLKLLYLLIAYLAFVSCHGENEVKAESHGRKTINHMDVVDNNVDNTVTKMDVLMPNAVPQQVCKKMLNLYYYVVNFGFFFNKGGYLSRYSCCLCYVDRDCYLKYRKFCFFLLNK